MRKLILLIFLFIISSGVFAQMFKVDTLYYNGETDNRINLLIMGDGYDSTEMNKFRTDAQSVADYFFMTPPFSTYRNFFNVFGIELISNQSGNDHPYTASDCPGLGVQPISSVDNYLETTFDNGGIHRCVYSNNSGLIYSIANNYVPYWDYLNVIVNTNYYGGCAGAFAFTTMNSSSTEIFTHEFGHMFGALSDEYESNNGITCAPGSSQGINVSQQTDTSLLVWKNWLSTSPIPTPAGTFCNQVGLYQGAFYCPVYWYRPKCDCKMRSLFQPYCEVCTEQLIYKINSLVNPIEDYLPLDTTILLCQGAQQEFSISVLNNADSTMHVQWFVDSVPVGNHSNAFTLNSLNYQTGIHEVKVVVTDTTIAARKLLDAYSQTWVVQISEMPNAIISTPGPFTFCMPGSVPLHAPAGINYSYKWMRNNIVIAGATDSLFNVVATGSYALIVSNNFCADTSAIMHFNVYAKPNSTLNVVGNDSVCAGSSIIISGVNCNTCRYQWLNDNITIPGATNYSFTAVSTGYYSLEIIDTFSTCFSVSDSQFVYVANFTAQASANHPTTICDNDSVTLTAHPAGYYYQWRDDGSILSGETDSTLTVHLSGHYDVIVSDGLCPDTSNVFFIVVNTSPIVTFGGVSSPVCLNDPVYNLYGIPFGGTFSGTGIIGSDFYPGVAGLGFHNINYYYVDNNGCSAVSTQSVLVDICNGIAGIEGEDIFTVYPNPTTGKVTVDFLLYKEKPVDLKIYDAIGNMIQSVSNFATVTGKNSLDIDLSRSGGGIFIIEINVEGKRLIRKLAVIK